MYIAQEQGFISDIKRWANRTFGLEIFDCHDFEARNPLIVYD